MSDVVVMGRSDEVLMSDVAEVDGSDKEDDVHEFSELGSTTLEVSVVELEYPEIE